MRLVLLPGLHGTAELFGPFIAALPAGLEVVSVSYPTEGPQDYDALEQIVRREIPTGEPLFLLAESFSGPIAITIAADPPPHLRGLLLCCTFATCPIPGLAPLAFLAKAVPRWLLLTRFARRLVLGGSASPALDRALCNAITGVPPRTLRERLRAVARVDVRAELRRVSGPILYLRATRDHLVPTAASRTILLANPAVHLHDVDGPHLLLQTRPAECVQILREVLLAAV